MFCVLCKKTAYFCINLILVISFSGVLPFAHAVTDEQLDRYFVSAPATDSLNKLLIVKQEIKPSGFVPTAPVRTQYKDSFDVIRSVYKFKKDYSQLADASSGYIRDTQFATDMNKTLITGWKTTAQVLFAMNGKAVEKATRISPTMVTDGIADLVTKNVEGYNAAELAATKSITNDIQSQRMTRMLNEIMNKAVRSNPLLANSPAGKRVEAMLKMTGNVRAVLRDPEFLDLLHKADQPLKDTFMVEFLYHMDANGAEFIKEVQNQLHENVKNQEKLRADLDSIKDKLSYSSELQKLEATEYTYDKFARDFSAIAGVASQLGGFFIAAGKMNAEQAKIINTITNGIAGIASVCMAVSLSLGPVGIAVAAIGAVISVLSSLFSKGDDSLANALRDLSIQIDKGFARMQQNFDKVFELLGMVIKQQEITYKAIVETQELIKEHNQKIATQMAIQFRILRDNTELGLQTSREILEYLKLGECKTFLNNSKEPDGNNNYIYLVSEESPYFKSYESRRAHFEQNVDNWNQCRNKISNLYSDALNGSPSSLLILKPLGLDKEDESRTPGDLSRIRSDKINAYRFLRKIWEEKVKDPKNAMYTVGRGVKKLYGPFASWWLREIKKPMKKTPELLEIPPVLLDPTSLAEISGYAMMVEPYFELTKYSGVISMYTEEELLKNPPHTEWNDRGKFLIMRSLMLLEKSLLQQSLLSGDLVLPELVSIFSDRNDPRRSELIYYMSLSESLSKNVMTAWILEQSSALRFKIFTQLRSEDKSALAENFGDEFSLSRDPKAPPGLLLMNVKYISPEILKVKEDEAKIALPNIDEVLNPQFMAGSAVQTILQEREEVQKRLLSYERNSFTPEIKNFVNGELLLIKAAQ